MIASTPASLTGAVCQKSEPRHSAAFCATLSPATRAATDSLSVMPVPFSWCADRSGAGTAVTPEAIVDLLAGEPEIGQRVGMARPGGPGGLRAQCAHGVRGPAGQRQPEMLVDRRDGVQRLCYEIVIFDVVEPSGVVPGPGRPQ